jgi:hypothetical protein
MPTIYWRRLIRGSVSNEAKHMAAVVESFNMVDTHRRSHSKSHTTPCRSESGKNMPVGTWIAFTAAQLLPRFGCDMHLHPLIVCVRVNPHGEQGLDPMVCACFWQCQRRGTYVLISYLAANSVPLNHSASSACVGTLPPQYIRSWLHRCVSSLRARSITRMTDSSRRCSMSKRVFLCCNRAVIEASFARHYKHSCRLTLTVNRRAGPR